ncbi:hypothetical protein HPB50_005149 [Hyalomma asiaticum]|uniref:Uncharacterized protein n=1 Tax=Hyalomma asiaticum TaxID=266040 RepID=A0ACB7RL77_HYAAI|nr:hypothetical protein HPB50_005149 [Hyalomma asiaticum]
MAGGNVVRSPPAVSDTAVPTPNRRKNVVSLTAVVVGLSCASLAFVVAFALIWFSVHPGAIRRHDNGTHETPFCCPKEAAKLFAVIDHQAVPCKDFFAYVCKNAIEQGFVQDNSVHGILWEVGARVVTGTSKHGVRAVAALQAFYRSCVTEVWQRDLRLHGAIEAILQIAYTPKQVTAAKLLRFALEVQFRYNLVFIFTIAVESEVMFFTRNLLLYEAYKPFCDDACYATTLSAVNAHLGANCTPEEMSEWERGFSDEYSWPDPVSWDDVHAVFQGIEAEEFKTIFLQSLIDVDSIQHVVVVSKNEMFADIERLWDPANLPTSLCHLLVILILDLIQLVVHRDATLSSPTIRSSELCEMHLRQSVQLWRSTNVAALTSPDKDRQMGAIFEATRRSFVGYEPLRRIAAAGNDTLKFESFVRNMSLLLPAGFELPELRVPALNDSGFVQNFFRLMSFEYDAKVAVQRQRLPVVDVSSPTESTRDRMLFVDEGTLYVGAPAYAWLSTDTRNPLLADAPVLASRMASLMWTQTFHWQGWSERSRNALHPFM